MTAEEDRQLLFRVVLRFAGAQLEKGGLPSFGAVLSSKRDVQLLMPESFKQNVTRDELEEYWFRELRKVAVIDGCRVFVSAQMFAFLGSRKNRFLVCLFISSIQKRMQQTWVTHTREAKLEDRLRRAHECDNGAPSVLFYSELRGCLFRE
jgi:hypothetical protein